MNAREFCLQHAATLWPHKEMKPVSTGEGRFVNHTFECLTREESAKLATERAIALYTEICEATAAEEKAEYEREIGALEHTLRLMTPTPRPRQAPEGRVEYFARCVCGGRTTVSVDAKDRPPVEFATAGYLFCGRCGATVPAGADPTREG